MTYYINPPDFCDVCQKPFPAEAGTVMIDGKTTFGPWANMCVPCHTRVGCGLGTGYGQQYKRLEDGRFQKVAG